MLKGQVPPKADDCDVPVDKMLELGKKLSVRGTPAIFFVNGSRVPGAISQQELEQRLQEK
jgi:thiol:disulfide interchange protein DsbC